MDWIERLNKAMEYLEEHMTEEISYEKAARIACCSTYHFQRMFAYMANVPLSEYIRRRRMSLAAEDLQSSDEKIVDIALKYGYASPTAFNRAFQGVHSVAPSLVKKGNVSVKAYPPISFTITIKGAVGLDYRIEEKKAFRVIGVCSPLQAEVEKNFAVVPQLSQQAGSDGSLYKLAGMMDGEPKGILGVSACNDEEEWKYLICVSSTLPLPEGWEEYLVEAYTWAVFTGTGSCPQAIQQLEQRIVTEWLPASGYEYADGPDIEVYLTPDMQNSSFEVWIPINRKRQ